MTFDSVLKNIDPIITGVLDRALSNKDISVDQATELLDADGTEMNVIVIVADELRRRTVGED
ncbi:MAG: 7,8-didemethyl-8-hydroxy-5-deazariboflavin synthase subunit CofH, partial [Candidatus Nitrosopolaris sp.]